MILIDKSSHVPAYIQLKQGIMRLIESAVYRPGDKLPSVREFVEKTGLSHLTVARAVSELVKDGAIFSEKGKGTFVASRVPSHTQTPQKPLKVAVLKPGTGSFEFDPTVSPFSYEIIQGINSGIAGYRFGTSFLSVEGYLAAGAAADLDGAILLNSDTCPELIPALEATGRPLVLINKPMADTSSNYVDGSNYAGATAAMDHLFHLGHQCIAFMGAPAMHRAHSQHERLRAYKDAMNQAGVELDERWVIHSEQGVGNGYESMKAVLGAPDCPTAVLASSDLNAVGIVKAVQEAGLSVPGDISVVGFMSLDVVANSQPFLTTVDLHMKELGFEAVVALENIISGRRNPPVQVQIDTALKVRETTGAVRKVT